MIIKLRCFVRREQEYDGFKSLSSRITWRARNKMTLFLKETVFCTNATIISVITSNVTCEMLKMMDDEVMPNHWRIDINQRKIVEQNYSIPQSIDMWKKVIGIS